MTGGGSNVFTPALSVPGICLAAESKPRCSSRVSMAIKIRSSFSCKSSRQAYPFEDKRRVPR